MQPIWLWCALGLVLLGLEMVSGTLYLLWLGLAALGMALLAWGYPELHVAWQALCYAVLSVVVCLAWRRYESSVRVNPRIGQAQGEEIGRTGEITLEIRPNQPGKIRFSQGVMGSKEWTAVSTQTLSVGQTATIVAVEGNSLRVRAT